MLRTIEIRRAGDWMGPVADTVRLSFDDRFRRRITMTGMGGLSFLFETDKATVLNHGDALILDDGRRVRVEAKPEPLLEICADDDDHRTRLAWHIGNRHLACEIADGKLYIRDDHVIAEMLKGLGAKVYMVDRPFSPEGGAYGGPAEGHHHHHHNDDDDPRQAHG